jgi:hypothetical protein
MQGSTSPRIAVLLFPSTLIEFEPYFLYTVFVDDQRIAEEMI